jgi:hypothetical protein
MNIISLILITVGLFILLFIWITSETKCKEKERVVVQYMCPNKSILDVQFSEDNNPSKVYSDLFQKPSPWVGGFSLEHGRTFTVDNKNKKK